MRSAPGALVTDKDALGTADFIYSDIREVCGEAPLQLSAGAGDAKLSMACEAENLGFSLPKCLEYTAKYIAQLDNEMLPKEEVPEFMAELERQWRILDMDDSGLVTIKELREAVWSRERDNAGVPVPEGQLAPEFQDIIDEVVEGTGSRPEFSYWDFVRHWLENEWALPVSAICVTQPDETWARV